MQDRTTAAVYSDCRSLEALTEQDFLCQSAWVILSSGMRESVVRERFPGISEAFLEWKSSQAIVQHQKACAEAALKWFGHKQKINAIVDVAQIVCSAGFSSILRSIREQGVDSLDRFSFIGPVTRWHLAKNIGLDVVKPDRHLVRIAAICGRSSPNALCREIANICDDKLSVIDAVLWRFATLRPDYLHFFSDFVFDDAAQR